MQLLHISFSKDYVKRDLLRQGGKLILIFPLHRCLSHESNCRKDFNMENLQVIRFCLLKLKLQ